MNPELPALDEIPLIVDLDGTFIRSDTTWDMLSLQLLQRPWTVPMLLRQFADGRETLKIALWRQSCLNVETFPIDPAVQSFVRTQADHQKVFLVSDASQELVNAVVAEHGVFSGGYGSAKGFPLTGPERAAQLTASFGAKRFDYLGNGLDDLSVWAVARKPLAAGVTGSTIAAAELQGIPLAVLSRAPAGMGRWFKALRVHQWLKNLLCFLPIIAAHRWGDSAAWVSVAGVFLALCVGASMTYLLNDLRDLAADRQHPVKRMRPLASGLIAVQHAGVAFLLLGVVWLSSVSWIGGVASVLLVGQLAASILYAVSLKSIPILDVIWLGLLYCNRIAIGSAVLAINPTAWLIAFALFFFVGLACAKRFRELTLLSASGSQVIPGRGYVAVDRDVILLMGYVSSMLSVLVLALYIAQPEITRLYPSPTYLWILCGLLFYWVSRLWLKANRGDFDDDPLEFIIKDPLSLILLAASLLIIVLASLR